MRNLLKYIFCIFAVTFLINNTAMADVYMQRTPGENMDYYGAGMSALQRRSYNEAVEYLEAALENDPTSTHIRNNLCVALTSRGTYYYNKNIDLEKAANDYRTVIYYLKYYGNYRNSDTINENIKIAEQNLDNVLIAQQVKTDALSRLKKGKELRGKGDLKAAVVEYVAASKERKYAFDSYVALGDIMSVLVNTYQAAVFYDKALMVNSKDASVHLKYGRVLYKLDKVDAAVKELNLATNDSKYKTEALLALENIWKAKITQNPKDAVAQMNLGVIYQEQNKFQKALQQYTVAQELAPQNQTIKLNLATLYQAMGNYTQALEAYNAFLKTSPNDVTVNLYKAATLAQMGRKQEALDLYNKLLVLNPENTEVKESVLELINSLPAATAYLEYDKYLTTYPDDYEAIYQYAFKLHENKNYDKALTYYQKSISLKPDNLDAYLNMASIYKNKNDTTKAIAVLNNAKQIFPSNAKITQLLADYNEEKSYALFEKASKLYDKKDYNDAIIVYKSIENPSDDVYLGLGACYQAMERYDEAISYYNKAVAMDASNPNSHYFLGLAYFYKKDYAKAEVELKKAMQLDSVNPDIQDAYKALRFAQSEVEMNKGSNLLDTNKIDESIISFTRAINLCNQNGYAYYYRGLAYDSKNLNAKAIADYKKAVELNPEINMSYYSMALSYEALKNKSEAKKMYQKFLSVTPDEDEYTKYARQRLTEL